MLAWPSSKGIISHRWINFGDPIPILPPGSAGFQHYGDGLYINKPRATRCLRKSCPMEVTLESQVGEAMDDLRPQSRTSDPAVLHLPATHHPCVSVTL